MSSVSVRSEPDVSEPVTSRPTWRDWIRVNQTTFGVFVVAALVYVVTLAVVPGFISLNHFFYTLQLAGFLGIVATGEAIVILTSGIDLSVASVITAVAVVVSTLFAETSLPTGVALAIGLGLGAGIGLVNGIGVTWFKIPPLVMTLASGSVVGGIDLVETQGSPNSGTSATLDAISNHNLGEGLTGTVIIWLVVIGFALWLLMGTRMGRYIYAIGTNVRAAQLSGVPLRRVTVLAYVISGITAGITGCLLLGYTGISFLTMGDPYLLPAIAAVVLGGTSILGGKGGAVGTALGAFLLTAIESLLTVERVSQASREMLEGAILLVVVVLYNYRSVFSSRRR